LSDYEDSWSEVRPEDDVGAFHNGRPSILRWEPDRYPDEPDPVFAKLDTAEETRIRRKIQRDAIFFAMSYRQSEPHQKARSDPQGGRTLAYMQASAPRGE
jgi:hypothetical protein